MAGLTIGQCEVDIMSRSTVAIFEIVEKAWATQNCTLVDMKVAVQQRPLLVNVTSWCDHFSPVAAAELQLRTFSLLID